jgi:hypothetical protein
MTRTVKAAAAAVALLAAACIEKVTEPSEPAGSCRPGQATMPVVSVPVCLEARGILSAGDREAAVSLLAAASSKRDAYSTDTSATSFWRSAELTRALQRIVDFYARGLFEDSARFHRMMDHLVVTEEYLGGTLRWTADRAWPQRTPYLSWSYYPNTGIYFQPVNTIQAVASLFPRANVPTDSLLAMGEQFYRYALWRNHGNVRFPVWEYEFTWNSGGVTVLAPWVSGQAQGYGIILFAENYRRTRNPLWRDRAYQALNSFRVTWDDGGLLLPDTTHGYWWEEFHPAVFIWNGAAQAALAVGELWRATDEPEVKRMFDRSVEALKYYTPEFDTGSWTLYSRTQWYNTVAYHQSCIRIMDALYTVSDDPWFLAVADRWRTYTPPPGVY